MHVFIAGLGSIGKRHARNFRALGVERLSGFDPDAGHAAEFVQQTGGTVIGDFDEALAMRPDLVVIASPNHYHLRQAMAAARAGLPLFIEKPLGTDLTQARQLLALLRERNLYAHVGSNWKFHTAFQQMKAMLDDGRLGRIVAMQVLAGQWLPDWHPWEDFRKGYSARLDLGGGAIYDTHELDYILWLAGSSAQRFCGFKQHDPQVLPIETEHTAICILQMQGGLLATLQTDYIQRRPMRRYFITGDAGSMEWDLHAGGITIHAAGSKEAVFLPAALDDLNEMYLAQSRHVLEDLRHGREPITPVPHMVAILELQLAWHRQQPWMAQETISNENP